VKQRFAGNKDATTIAYVVSKRDDFAYGLGNLIGVRGGLPRGAFRP